MAQTAKTTKTSSSKNTSAKTMTKPRSTAKKNSTAKATAKTTMRATAKTTAKTAATKAPAASAKKRVTAKTTPAAKKPAAKTGTRKATNAKASKTIEPKPGTSEKKKADEKRQAKKVSLVATIVTGVICAFLGVLLGFYPLGSGLALGGKTTLSEGELNSPVGMYIYKGVPNFITARDALESGVGLTSAQKSDGTYSYPSADAILASIRTAVLNSEVTARGITITDEEMKDYAQTQLGSTDYTQIATAYGLDIESVQNYIRQAAGINKLKEEITGIDLSETAPLAPEEGKDAATYKDYILNLLGSNWNAETNSWANTDNAYYDALQGFNPDQATYDQASAAFSIASQQYSNNSTSAAQSWNDFVNEILMNCQVRIGEAIM